MKRKEKSRKSFKRKNRLKMKLMKKQKTEE